jgi:hypothetical protein
MTRMGLVDDMSMTCVFPKVDWKMNGSHDLCRTCLPLHIVARYSSRDSDFNKNETSYENFSIVCIIQYFHTSLFKTFLTQTTVAGKQNDTCD